MKRPTPTQKYLEEKIVPQLRTIRESGYISARDMIRWLPIIEGWLRQYGRKPICELIETVARAGYTHDGSLTLDVLAQALDDIGPRVELLVGNAETYNDYRDAIPFIRAFDEITDPATRLWLISNPNYGAIEIHLYSPRYSQAHHRRRFKKKPLAYWDRTVARLVDIYMFLSTPAQAREELEAAYGVSLEQTGRHVPAPGRAREESDA